MLVETEAERRYNIDNDFADMRLEGLEPSEGLVALSERYVRGEITAAEYTRLGMLHAEANGRAIEARNQAAAAARTAA